MYQVFVYGTLLFSEVVEKLTGKSFKSTPAVLIGFKRVRVKGVDYPAIVECSGSKVNGIILHDVDDQSLRILTFYEGSEYVCQDLPVLEGTIEKHVKVFVWIADELELLKEDWDPENFRINYLRVYLDQIIPETLTGFK